MKTLSAEMAQEYGVYEDWKNTQPKNQKIQTGKLRKNRKYIKKTKTSKKMKSKQVILGTSVEISTKKEKIPFTGDQLAEIDEKIKEQNEKSDFSSKEQNIFDIYQKVSELFSLNIFTSQMNNNKNSKSMKKSLLKKFTQSKSCSIKDFVEKRSDIPQLKVLDLLQNKKIPLFQSTRLQDIENCENEAQKFLMSDKYLDDLENNNCKQQKQLQQSMTIILRQLCSSKSTLIKVNKNLTSYQLEMDDKNFETLSFCESEFIKQFSKFQPLWEKQICDKINENQMLKYIAKRLIVLLKCYKSNNLRIKKIYEKIIKKVESLENQQHSHSQDNLYSLSNEDFYTKCLIKKCLIKTFSEEQTLIKNQRQLWNFFKLSHYNEQSIIHEGFHDPESYHWIESQQEYKEYMSRIMNKKIPFKPILHTSCKACFSSHVEKSNMIIKCPSCKYRIHKRCGRMQDQCDRCKYKKIGTSLKERVKKCFICHNETNSLMLHKIKGRMFAHNFCIFAHNLWAVEEGRLQFDFEKFRLLKAQNSSQIIDQSQQKAQENSQQKYTKYSFGKSCKFCRKGSQMQKYFLKKCQNCDKSFHILCSYLNGCKISINNWYETFEADLKFICCQSQQHLNKDFEKNRKNLEMSRKYKLNYEKFAVNYGFQNANFNIDVVDLDRKLTTLSYEQENKLN